MEFEAVADKISASWETFRGIQEQFDLGTEVLSGWKQERTHMKEM